MKNRRSLIGAAIIVGCISLALAVVMLPPPPPGITKANFDRIEEGMTQADVRAILGEASDSTVGNLIPNAGILQWNREDGIQVWVQFFDDKAIRKHFNGSTETIFHRLRRWLHIPM